jgi:two-component system, NarL family, response regulator NreC
MSVRILLVDDHKIVRVGLRSLIEKQSDWTVCGEAEDGQEAIELARKHQPDVVVMDIGLPKLDGSEATRSICAIVPDVKIVALSVHQNASFVARMLRAGAKGYVPKSAAYEELVDAVKTIVEGKHYVSPIVTGFVVEQFILEESQKSASGVDLLTPTERQVLTGIASGLQSKEIAAELDVSPRTVDTHRQSVMKKLNASGIADLTRMAIQFGLIELK